MTHRDLVGFLAALVPERNGWPTGAAPTRKFLSNDALPLKGLFAMALREGWIAEDPALGLPSYKPKRKRAADPVRREEYLAPEEIWAVIAELESEQDRAVVLCMAMAGLRPGEAVALRWQDVDLEGSAFRIVESRTMGVTGAPKSGIGRSVPMPEEVAHALEGVGRRKVMTRREDRVFTRRGTGHLDLDALRGRFNGAQDAAGVAPRRELRQLRNTFGTVCATGIRFLHRGGVAAAEVPLGEASPRVRSMDEWRDGSRRRGTSGCRAVRRCRDRARR